MAEKTAAPEVVLADSNEAQVTVQDGRALVEGVGGVYDQEGIHTLVKKLGAVIGEVY